MSATPVSNATAGTVDGLTTARRPLDRGAQPITTNRPAYPGASLAKP